MGRVACRRVTRARKLSAVLLPAVMLAAVGGCADPDGNGAPATTTATATTTRAVTSTSGRATSSIPTPETVVKVYLMRADKLAVAHRRIPAGPAVLNGALVELLRGPSPTDIAAGLGSNVPAGTELRGVSIADGTATIDLSTEFESGGGSLSMFSRLAQLTFTATQFPSVQRVELRLDGRDVTVFSGEGLELPATLSRTEPDSEDVLAAIFVESPAPNDEVGHRFTASGTSNTFEAVHRLQVLGPGGAVLVDEPVMASSGTGTRGTWNFDVVLADSVTGAVTLRVFEPSAKDGAPINQVDLPLVVE